MKLEWLDKDPRISVYQSRGYGEAVSSTAGAEWDVIGDEAGRWRLPLCISRVEGTEYFDAVSPYGYPGIFASTELTKQDIGRAWTNAQVLMEARGIVAAFLRFTPYRQGIELSHPLPNLRLQEVSETVVIDLLGETEMWNAMLGRSRTAIRKAERHGLRGRIVAKHEMDLTVGSGFRRVYDLTMERVNAGSQHRHTDSYYRSLLYADDVDLRLVDILDGDDEVVASSILLIDQEAVHYHLSGSETEAAKNGANNLLIWSAMQWASNNGHERLHLGGGTMKDDSLFRFKSSFGGTPLPYHVGRLVVQPEVYERMIMDRAERLQVSAESLYDSPYFPGYRATL